MTRFGTIRLVAAIVLCAGAGVASASALMPPPGAESIGGPHTLQPDEGPADVRATAPDPAGGLRWAVRVYRSRTGQTCPEAGRLSAGSFGATDGRGQFRPLPVEAAGSCGDLARSLAAFAVNRYGEKAGEGARTAVFGAVAPAVRTVTLTTSGAAQTLELVSGSFLAVGAGGELHGATIAFTTADGRTTSYRLEPSDP